MKKFLYIIPVLVVTSIASQAAIDSNHMSTEQFLINTGYSADVANTLEAQKRNPYGPYKEQRDTRTFWMKLYNYIDPVSNGNRTFPIHDTKINSNWQDL